MSGPSLDDHLRGPYLRLAMKIIIVDDSPETAAFYKMALKGHDVEVCTNAYEFLIAMEYSNPDICIIDVNMSQMNGVDAIRNAGNKTMKVIIISADDLYKTKRAAEKLKHEGFNVVGEYEKPILHTDLRALAK
jgi:DNA-binding response OmpR family regulator